jgi:AcrR family transcriptional regulator
VARDVRRREEWTGEATDYVLQHGLIGLSLRPLAAALGTSDRMLLYHFGTKDELVASLLRHSNDRSVGELDALPASEGMRAAVHDLWAAMRSPTLQPCARLYVEASALGLLGREPYASVVREGNATWMGALVAHLVRSGVPRSLGVRAAKVIDAAFMGFALDLPLDLSESVRAQAVDDLAEAVAALAQ